METKRHDFFRPWATRRKRIYLACAVAALGSGGVFVLLVAVGIAPPKPTDVIMAIVTTPILFIALLAPFWDSPGEGRTFLEKCVEFSTVFLFLSGTTEVAWELPFVILDKAGKLNGLTSSDHALWVWWSYGAADAAIHHK